MSHLVENYLGFAVCFGPLEIACQTSQGVRALLWSSIRSKLAASSWKTFSKRLARSWGLLSAAHDMMMKWIEMDIPGFPVDYLRISMYYPWISDF